MIPVIKIKITKGRLYNLNIYISRNSLLVIFIFHCNNFECDTTVTFLTEQSKLPLRLNPIY